MIYTVKRPARPARTRQVPIPSFGNVEVLTSQFVPVGGGFLINQGHKMTMICNPADTPKLPDAYIWVTVKNRLHIRCIKES